MTTASQRRRAERDAAIAGHYQSGMSIKGIMDVVGVARATVFSALERQGVRLRGHAADGAEFRTAVERVLWSSCGKCDHDEAEGGVVDHCDKCCRRIVTELHGMLRGGAKK